MNRWNRSVLLSAFVNGNPIKLVTCDGRIVVAAIAWIEREDGSGMCFNVRLYGEDRPTFVRCTK